MISLGQPDPHCEGLVRSGDPNVCVWWSWNAINLVIYNCL